MLNLLLFVVSLLSALALTPQLAGILPKRKNYQGKHVATACGVVLPLLGTPLLLAAVWLQLLHKEDLIGFGVVFGFFAFVGLIDDIAGNIPAKGFSGHLQAAAKRGQLTTGLLKALLGGMVAVLAALLDTPSLGEALLNGVLLALTANAFNLVDKRPGRTGKLFLFAAVLLAGTIARLELLVLAGLVLGYLVSDLREEAMLGDTGAYALGAYVGWYVGQTSLAVRVLLVLPLVFVQFYGERNSISSLIDTHPVLHRIDQIGRRH